MKIETITNEPRRGCGYRKAGGLYLMGGTSLQSCGKLPIPLEICPVCGQGIKPSRSWTWINGAELIEDITCVYLEQAYNLDEEEATNCEGCMLDRPPTKVGLLWVGDMWYTLDTFMDEAQKMGISRKIKFLPKDFKIGKTHVWFAHRKAIRNEAKELDEEHNTYMIVEKWTPAVFTAMIPTHLEYIVKEGDTEDHLKRLEKKKVKLIRLIRTEGEDE